MVIEDKEIGLKIANKIEAMWTDLKTRIEADLDNMNKQIIINQAMIELCVKKIEESKVTLE